MNAHPKIEAGDQLELIKSASGGARPFEIPPCADDPKFIRQPENYAEADLHDFEQIAKGRGETYVRPLVQDLAKRWKWSEEEVTEFLSRIDKAKSRQLVTVPQHKPDNPAAFSFSTQNELTIRNVDGAIVIHHPPCNGTQEEGETVSVAPENVVTFIYRVLEIAGFPPVEIILKDDCMFPTELTPGDRASDFRNEGGQ